MAEKDVFSSDVVEVLKQAIGFAKAASVPFTPDLFIAMAARLSYIGDLSSEDVTALIESARADSDVNTPGERSQTLTLVLNSVSAAAIRRERPARIEHVVGAILHIAGLPKALTENRVRAMARYVQTWLVFNGQAQVHRQRMIDAIAVPLDTIQSPPYINMPEVEEEIAIGLQGKVVVITGPPGCGKSRVMFEAARVLLPGQKVYVLDNVRAQLGAKLRGDFEERFFNAFQEARNENAALLIDDSYFVDEACSSGNSISSFPEILAYTGSTGALIPIIISCRENVATKLLENSVFERRAHVVRMQEPSEDVCVRILMSHLQSLDTESPTIDEEGALEAVRLAKRYRNSMGLPASAIDLATEVLMKSLSMGIDENVFITKQDLAERISATTGIPVGEISADESAVLNDLKERLGKRVRGQDEAIDVVSRSIRRNRAGFSEPGRPVGSFLFLGPTGVGKTETARALADTIYGGKMHRIDMSEYSEQHSISRLIGSPPGYVGYGEGGRLVNILTREPYSLILLDEIEKAHPNVWNVFLQVFEEGCITDGRGRKADCSNAVFIMTSNAGSKMFEEREMVGFRQQREDPEGRTERIRDDAKKALRNVFPPEFLNRIDAVVVFRELDDKQLPLIATTMLNNLKKRLDLKKIQLTWTRGVPETVARRGFSKTDGARPMRRLIRSEIEDALVDVVLKHQPTAVKIHAQNDKFHLKVEEA